MSPASPRRGVAALLADLDEISDDTTAEAAVPDGPPSSAALAVAVPMAPKPRKAQKLRLPSGAAWEQAEESLHSRMRRPGDWANVSLRLPDWLDKEIQARVNFYRQKTGDRQMGKNHIINAALAGIPDKPAELVRLGAEWQTRYGIGKTLTRGSGTRLHRDVAGKIGRVTDLLRSADDRVYTWQVAAWLIVEFLGKLDSGDAADGQAGPAGGNDDDGDITGSDGPGRLAGALGPGIRDQRREPDLAGPAS